jgi:hypothetical protein
MDGWGHAWVVRVRCSHYGFPNYLFPLTTTTSTFFKTNKKKKNLPFGGGITKRGLGFKVSPKEQKRRENPIEFTLKSN